MKVIDMMLALARSAANLKVVTVVGTPVLSGRLDAPDVVLPTQPEHCIVTNINLIDGDVTQVVSPGFLKGDTALEAVRTWHAEMVEAARASVATNLSALGSLAERLGTGWRDQEVPPQRGGHPLPGQDG
jgi:hypothetical protein